jgi:hypothetical protein
MDIAQHHLAAWPCYELSMALGALETRVNVTQSSQLTGNKLTKQHFPETHWAQRGAQEGCDPSDSQDQTSTDCFLSLAFSLYS